MKHVFFSVFLLVGFFSLFMESHAQYYENGQWIGGNITFGTGTTGIGVLYENGMDKNISVGGSLKYWSWDVEERSSLKIDFTILYPQAFAFYHFLPQEQIDPYAGVKMGVMIYSSDWTSDDMNIVRYNEPKSSSFTFSIAGGVRYFFSPKVAARGEIEVIIVGEDYTDFSQGAWLIFGADITL